MAMMVGESNKPTYKGLKRASERARLAEKPT